MLDAIRSSIMRMINEDDKKRTTMKKRTAVEKSKKIKHIKKSPVKKAVGWQYNSKTMRYEPTLAKSMRHNF